MMKYAVWRTGFVGAPSREDALSQLKRNCWRAAEYVDALERLCRSWGASGQAIAGAKRRVRPYPCERLPKQLPLRLELPRRRRS